MPDNTQRKAVDYDRIGSNYNRRYEANTTEGVGHALMTLAEALEATRILEVGCGTGHWLTQLTSETRQVVGLDPSAGMLNEAQAQPASLGLTQGFARRLPFRSESFDLVFCVNAIHHFQNPCAFIQEAYWLLRNNGVLAVVGQDPHDRRESWYVYEYFDGVYERDLARFPKQDKMKAWMAKASFSHIRRRLVEEIHDPKVGRKVLADPFIKKDACSQLALLSDAAYEAGLVRIKTALDRAEAAHETLCFPSDLVLNMVSGRK